MDRPGQSVKTIFPGLIETRPKMSFFKTPGIFEKNARLHRLILSYIPPQEREDLTKPFEERSVFEKRKEYDVVIEEQNHRTPNPEKEGVKKYYYDWFLINQKIYALGHDIRPLEAHSYYKYQQNPNNPPIDRAYFIEASKVFNAVFLRESIFHSGIFNGKHDHLRLYSFEYYRPERILSWSDNHNYKDFLVEFLTNNGMKVSRRTRNKTFLKLLMSF